MENLNSYPSLNMEAEALQLVLNLAEKDPSILIGLIESVLDHSPTILNGLKEAVKNGDKDRIILETHSLRSSTALVGASELSEKCKAFELRGKAGDLSNAPQYLEEILHEYSIVEKDLGKWKSDLETES